jgi:RNA-directed DNA polymerase
MTIASRPSENPTEQARLMEQILERENMRRALKRVRKNKGAPGVDGMTVEQLPGYLKRHWPKIKRYPSDGRIFLNLAAECGHWAFRSLWTV